MRREWIYTDVLFKICDVLDYDFFKACSDWRKSHSCPESVLLGLLKRCVF